MRILLTGATGFVGGHLAEVLLAAGGSEIHGLSRRPTWPVEWHHLAERVHLHVADLKDAAAVSDVLGAVRPDQIYHLAGYAQTGQSFREPDAAWAGNLGATRTLFDAVAESGATPRILAVTSGLIYGANDPPERPCDEMAPLRPDSPYAASKAAADLLAYQVTRWPGLDVIRARPFNQIGPRQSPQFAVGSFARQLARVEMGLAPPRVEVGELSASRDLTDVRDMVEAFRRLVEFGQRGEAYNAGSGTAVRMADVLDELRDLSLSTVEVVTTAERLRPTEPPVLTADSSKLRQTTGWRPAYTLRQTLSDTLEYWRRAVASESAAPAVPPGGAPPDPAR